MAMATAKEAHDAEYAPSCYSAQVQRQQDSVELASAKMYRRIARRLYEESQRDPSRKVRHALYVAMKRADDAYDKLKADDAARYRRWAFATAEDPVLAGVAKIPALRVIPGGAGRLTKPPPSRPPRSTPPGGPGASTGNDRGAA